MTVRQARRIVAAIALAVPAARAQQPFAHADTAALHKQLDALAAAHHGVLGYAISNLDTGERLSLRGDETFPTASLIKVPILVTLYDLVEQKQLGLDDPLRCSRSTRFPGAAYYSSCIPGCR